MAGISKLTRNFTETDVGDEIILMRLDNGELLSLTGARPAIWRLIDGRRDRAALVTALAVEFDVARERIEHQVDELLTRLTEIRLIARD
jgi:pyrroloquinoline quinone biosynthesis protein D